MLIIKCKFCGKTITVSENVQYWPDCCQECRAKYQPEERITRQCRKCKKSFTFLSTEKRWPKDCPECRKIKRPLFRFRRF